MVSAQLVPFALNSRCHLSPPHPSVPLHFLIPYPLGDTKARLKEVIEECQLHRNKLHSDIIECLLREKMGDEEQKPECGVIEKPLENIPKYPISLKATKFIVNCFQFQRIMVALCEAFLKSRGSFLM